MPGTRGEAEVPSVFLLEDLEAGAGHLSQFGYKGPGHVGIPTVYGKTSTALHTPSFFFPPSLNVWFFWAPMQMPGVTTRGDGIVLLNPLMLKCSVFV